MAPDGTYPLFPEPTGARGREDTGAVLEDAAARAFAVDPRHNVVLEASAGTGKTSVLVARYLNLLRAGVDPQHVLAITFTRQAAAEMRERIIDGLRADAQASNAGQDRWAMMRDRLSDISIATIDAFCLALLREFPLEADLDPGFGVVDETELPRLVDHAVEGALRRCAHLAERDPSVAALLALLGPGRTRNALAGLLRRRLVVPAALHRYLAGVPRGMTAESVCRDAAERLRDRLDAMAAQLARVIDEGPSDDAPFALVSRDLERVRRAADGQLADTRRALERFRQYFLTRDGAVRRRFRTTAHSQAARARYRASAQAIGGAVRDTLARFDRDVNVVMAQAVQRLFGIAESEYRRALDAEGALDFSDLLKSALDLLRQMDEFAQSRFRLESRYQHVLVDEFQDTSRAQWELVSLLVKAWGEGRGLVDEAPVPPTIFVVGDRKQSIYRFRDADLSVLRDAAKAIGALRPDGANGGARQSIAHSFRAVPALLAFVNDLFTAIADTSTDPDAFRYDASDRFPTRPLAAASPAADAIALGLLLEPRIEACADSVAEEVTRVLDTAPVRDRATGDWRPARPADIAILFRSRESHRAFEHALARRAVPTFVYKGLGFFDADEIKDVRALIRYLAAPASDLCAAALLRSRFVGLSDPGLAVCSGRMADVADGAQPLPADLMSDGRLSDDDRRRLDRLRASTRTWVDLVDQVPPAEVLDHVLREGAYAFELRGSSVVQARENLKKIRRLVRRLQNRGFATMARVADQVEHLSEDLSTAVIEAGDAVNLMTVHAAKGLEFPIVFLVDLGRGTGTHVAPVRVVPDRGDGRPSVTVWPYKSELDELERRRDREETKRLLYVAATRARDRLYLSTVLRDGRTAFSRGSFGDVLPPSLVEVFDQAASSPAGLVDWQPRGSQVAHRMRVCRLSSTTEQHRTGVRGQEVAVELRPVDLAPVAVRELLVDRDATDREAAEAVDRVVHRLLQRHGGRSLPRDQLARHAEALIGADPESASMREPSGLVEQAASLYSRLAEHPDVAPLASMACLFDVPFSMRRSLARSGEGRAAAGVDVLRGTIDCLARADDGHVVVLELRTGPPHPSHQRQLELCVAAARAILPGADVDGRLVYA